MTCLSVRGRTGRAQPLLAALALSALALSSCAGPEVSARLDALRVDWRSAEAALAGGESQGKGNVATGITLPITHGSGGTGSVWANHNQPREVPVPLSEEQSQKPSDEANVGATFKPPVLLASADASIAAALAEAASQTEATDPKPAVPTTKQPLPMAESYSWVGPLELTPAIAELPIAPPEPAMPSADQHSTDRLASEGVVVLAQATTDNAGAPATNGAGASANGAAANGAGASAIVGHEAEARVPLGPEGICETPAGHCPIPDPHHYPDEYICDGGDRGYPVHYDAYNRLGLETSDAVAEFVDHTGKLQVRPTNRVCVYAPRFAAMRTLDTPIAETSAQGVASAERSLRTGRLGNRIATDVSRQQTPPVGLRMRSRASGVDVPTIDGGYNQIAFAGQYSRYRSGHQEISFLHTGRLKGAEEAWLASGLQAAAVWTRDQFPVITGRTQGAEEVVHRFKAEEMIGTDGEGIGELRIVKLADREVARPGDVLTFTLRYDNLGDGPLHHIRVVDNLSPRLEYVEDSETSDRAGTLYLEDNQEGSLVLIFELDDPLPAKTGGVITFRARVR